MRQSRHLGLYFVGGGLAATDALLRVQAPAGSTVTITKGALTKTDMGHENADDNSVYGYYFIIHQSQFDGVNPWTVTATLGGDTASDTVIINAAGEYDVELMYRQYIYRNGTQYEPLSEQHETYASITFGSSYIEQSYSGSNYLYVCVRTTSKVDVTSFSTLVFVAEVETMYSASLRMGLATNTGVNPSFQTSVKPTANPNVQQTISVDVTNISGSYYICSSGMAKLKIYQIYLLP